MSHFVVTSAPQCFTKSKQYLLHYLSSQLSFWRAYFHVYILIISSIVFFHVFFYISFGYENTDLWFRLDASTIQMPKLRLIYKYLSLKFFLSDTFTCPILRPLIPLFWISGDVSSGFQSQSGFCLIRIAEANVMYIHSPRSTCGATRCQPLDLQ